MGNFHITKLKPL